MGISDQVVRDPLGEKVGTWWLEVLAGEQGRDHPIYGASIHARLRGDTLTVSGSVGSKSAQDALRKEILTLNEGGIHRVRFKVAVAQLRATEECSGRRSWPSTPIPIRLPWHRGIWRVIRASDPVARNFLTNNPRQWSPHQVLGLGGGSRHGGGRCRSHLSVGHYRSAEMAEEMKKKTLKQPRGVPLLQFKRPFGHTC